MLQCIFFAHCLLLAFELFVRSYNNDEIYYWPSVHSYDWWQYAHKEAHGRSKHRENGRASAKGCVPVKCCFHRRAQRFKYPRHMEHYTDAKLAHTCIVHLVWCCCCCFHPSWFIIFLIVVNMRVRARVCVLVIFDIYLRLLLLYRRSYSILCALLLSFAFIICHQ